MNSPPNGSHRGTYDAVFRRPAAHNLQWRDVWSMLGTVADVQEHNGTLKVTRNGQALVLHRPRGKDLADLKELAQVRHFLERSGAPCRRRLHRRLAHGAHLLVVIDHREAASTGPSCEARCRSGSPRTTREATSSRVAGLPPALDDLVAVAGHRAPTPTSGPPTPASSSRCAAHARDDPPGVLDARPAGVARIVPPPSPRLDRRAAAAAC